MSPAYPRRRREGFLETRIFGYARVSTRDQNEDRQLIALAEARARPEFLFVDKQSGKDFNRPAYRKLYRKLKKGDMLVVKSIDRLGRNYQEIMEEWRNITKKKGADIRVLDMPLLDTSQSRDLLGTFISDLVLQLLSFVAQNERENIRRRQAEGIAAAKARGVEFGRPHKSLPNHFDELLCQWQRKELTAAEIAKLCGVSRSTIYRRRKQTGES